jgi:hypothetical protein
MSVVTVAVDYADALSYSDLDNGMIVCMNDAIKIYTYLAEKATNLDLTLCFIQR